MKTLIKILCLSVLWFSCENPTEPEPQDTEAPIVVITFPVAESQLTETTTIRVEVSDESPITKVIFLIDGISVFEDMESPYEYECDICLEEGENHTILVKAEDESGNQGQTDAMPIQTNGVYDCYDICGGNIFDTDEDGICDDVDNCIGVILWGGCYNIEETTSLYLQNQGLTGEIPFEIGNLTNLEYLYLNSNKLTGVIPSEICNLTNLWFLALSDNQLCPPYPECISQYDIDSQDTSNCP